LLPFGPELSVFSSVVEKLINENIQDLIFPVILHGCETLSLSLREVNRLRVLENRALRWIFCQKRDEVTGGWRKLHNADLHDLCSLTSIIRIIKSRRMRWAGLVARMREKGNAYRLLVGKRPLVRTRRRWVYNIGIYLGEVG
jgi:hypothetical protein